MGKDTTIGHWEISGLVSPDPLPTYPEGFPEEVLKAFEAANGVPVPYKIVERRPGDLATCYADPAKSAEKLGWKAEKTLVDMCRDTWRWQSQNPMGFGE